MELSIDELETIKKKSYQEGYDEGHKLGFEKGYVKGVDFSDSCLLDRISELEEALGDAKDEIWALYVRYQPILVDKVSEFGVELGELLDKYAKVAKDAEV